MPWTPNIKKIVDPPVWDWINFYPTGNSNPGTSNCWDGSRWMYWAIQSGTTTAGSASTTQLWRYDTWTDAWQFLVTLASGNNGLDLEFDAIRNVVYYIAGTALTTIQVFNLNTVSVTINNVACAAWTLTTLAVLPAAAGAASSLTMPDDTVTIGALTPGGATSIDTDVVAAGSTSTQLNSVTQTFGPGMVGLYVRMTSGALAGQIRQITAVVSASTLTVAAFTGNPAVGDTFVVQLPEGTSTGTNSTTTLNDTLQTWIVNQYANSDVVIVAGTGNGQRRRIASNTATAITLAAAVTGNARTGPWATTPDATSVYRIVPSSDFLYYQVGGGTGLYRLDVVQTTGSAWSALLAALPAASGGGANTMYAQRYDPFGILALRGAGTGTVYRYNLGTNVWTTLTTFVGGETFNTGASAAMAHGTRRMVVQKEGSQRILAFDLTTGILEAFGWMPYAAPSAFDGHRARFIISPDGVQYLYIMRAGGQEFFRVPVEHVLQS